MGLKTCFSCGEAKSLDSFDKPGASRRSSTCRACAFAYPQICARCGSERPLWDYCPAAGGRYKRICTPCLVPRAPGVDVVCGFCGVGFRGTPGRKYCSPVCRAKGAKRSSDQQVVTARFRCEVCGVPCEVTGKRGALKDRRRKCVAHMFTKVGVCAGCGEVRTYDSRDYQSSLCQMCEGPRASQIVAGWCVRCGVAFVKRSGVGGICSGCGGKCSVFGCGRRVLEHGLCHGHSLHGPGWSPRPDPTYLYLMHDEVLGIHQFGVTASLESRVQQHRRDGFELLDAWHTGDVAAPLERELVRWLPSEWVVPGHRERWFSVFAAPESLHGLFDLAAIPYPAGYELGIERVSP